MIFCGFNIWNKQLSLALFYTVLIQICRKWYLPNRAGQNSSLVSEMYKTVKLLWRIIDKSEYESRIIFSRQCRQVPEYFTLNLSSDLKVGDIVRPSPDNARWSRKHDDARRSGGYHDVCWSGEDEARMTRVSVGKFTRREGVSEILLCC